MLEGGLIGLIILALDIWAILHVGGSNASTGWKIFWLLLIIVLPLAGFLIWLVFGPRRATV